MASTELGIRIEQYSQALIFNTSAIGQIKIVYYPQGSKGIRQLPIN